ncbi:MAG: peptide deformylase [Rhodospirillales bacterium]|nr:peptide deformylase [Rhodospirillales bacterium]
MALLKIARMGHPVLSRPADPVADPTAPAIAALVEDMFETMLDAPGVGLAAPQVHVPLRVVVYYVPEARATAEEGGGTELTALINPVLTPIGDERDWAREACLSVPEMSGLVPRFKRIGLSALDLSENPIEREVSGFHARLLQHECDHLDGILYPMRMDDLSSFGYNEELAQREAPEEASDEEAGNGEAGNGEASDE